MIRRPPRSPPFPYPPLFQSPLPHEQRAGLRFVLRAIGSAPAKLVFGGRHERMLQRMSTSRGAQMRSGFQALKRLATFLHYSTTDVPGYRPSAQPPARPAALRLTAPTSVMEC